MSVLCIDTSSVFVVPSNRRPYPIVFEIKNRFSNDKNMYYEQ